jgi:hypothetical protein
MGLDKEWAANVVAQVGNYGEMWSARSRPAACPGA